VGNVDRKGVEDEVELLLYINVRQGGGNCVLELVRLSCCNETVSTTVRLFSTDVFSTSDLMTPTYTGRIMEGREEGRKEEKARKIISFN